MSSKDEHENSGGARNLSPVEGRELTRAELRQRRVASITHGAYARSSDARKVVYWRKRRRLRKLRDQFPDLPASADPILDRLAQVQLVLDGIHAELNVGGITTASGNERRLLSEARLWTRQEQELLRELRELVAKPDDLANVLARMQQERS